MSNGHCELQTLAYNNGMDHVRYDYQFPKWGVDLTNPRYGMDHNRCILCGRCVRVCWHVEGAGTLNIAGRGAKSQVIADLIQPWGDAESCTLVRQVRHGLPDGRAVPAGRDGRRDAARPREARIHHHGPGEKTMDPLKLRLATVWMGGCAGCHMSFLDLDEFLIDLAPRVDVVFSPIVDAKEYPENVDLVLIEGAVCNEEHVEMAHKIRRRTKLVVAFGDCAVTGNVTAMRNQLGLDNADNVLQRAYVELADANPGIPKLPGIVPALLERVMPLREVIHVDYFLPGCPPPAERIKSLVGQLLEGKTPRLEGVDIKFG